MTSFAKKRKNRDVDERFFLYVAFHSIFTSIVNLFKDND